jgi:hypothetical protein
MKSLQAIREKSVSQAQQKMMGMALAYKRGEMDDASPEVKKMADSMSMKDLEDFAKTKHKGLPVKKESVELEEARWEVTAGKHAIGSARYDDKEIITVTPEQAKKLTKYFKKTGDGEMWKKLFQGAKGGAENQKSFDSIVKSIKESVEEAYKTPEEAQAFEDGKKAARKGKKYSDNPHKDGAMKTAWSKGHNKIRESNGKSFFDIREARRNAAQDTYFDTYSAAVQHAKAQAEKQGYEVEEDDWFQQVTTGKGKPGRGKTTRHTLKLMKGGKPTRKGLAIQVYNRDTDKNTYELNYYIS